MPGGGKMYQSLGAYASDSLWDPQGCFFWDRAPSITFDSFLFLSICFYSFLHLSTHSICFQYFHLLSITSASFRLITCLPLTFSLLFHLCWFQRAFCIESCTLDRYVQVPICTLASAMDPMDPKQDSENATMLVKFAARNEAYPGNGIADNFQLLALKLSGTISWHFECHGTMSFHEL